MTTPTFLQDALDYSLLKIRASAGKVSGFFPEMTDGDAWVGPEDGGWTGGHWTGLLWLAFAATSDPAFEAAARQWTARLAPRQFDTGTHDLGFLFELSHILGYKLTGEESFKDPAIRAARSLCQRFNVLGEYFQAWGPLNAGPELRGRAIIDTMMNLDLLFWATRQTDEPQFAQMARAHAQTAFERHIRPNGTTSHVTDFNPDSGEFLKQDTHQGLSPTSFWARGQAWAVYGYAECFRETANPFYLEISHRLAATMLDQIPADHVPYWDYSSPLIPDDVRDSSAGAILASALLLQSQIDPDSARSLKSRDQALAILESLWVNYSTRGTVVESILLHATRSKPHGLMDTALIYGDYYFLEGILRLLRPDLPL
jgi:unsaturated chondroitin disaccharide hydrolase